jgi:hypothetical protein
MTRGRRALVMTFAVQAVVLVAILTAALDLYAHRRVENVAGWNIWGYRGPVAHQRQPNEIRIVVIGGTRAFALGMPATWTPATVLRQQVMLVTDRRGGRIRPVVSLTLARPGALPGSYAGTLDHFSYLRPDYICIYDDLGVGGAPQPEETSGFYARTGYRPILPLVLQEKKSMRALGSALARVDRLMARRSAPRSSGDPQSYANDMMDAVNAALARAHGVVVALSPAEAPFQSANRAALRPRLDATRARTPALRVVDLTSERALRDPSLRLDGWNYGGDAVLVAAKAITPAMLDLIARDDRAAARRR